MALFGIGKKKEEKAACCPEATTEEPCCCGEEKTPCCEGARDGVCCVKVLGSGCKNCHTLLENAQAAVKNLNLGIEVEYITDLQKIMSYGVMSMPALVINDKIASIGKVLKPADIEALLHKFGV